MNSPHVNIEAISNRPGSVIHRPLSRTLSGTQKTMKSFSRVLLPIIQTPQPAHKKTESSIHDHKHKTTEFKVVEQISKSKYPVYLAQAVHGTKMYALKVFPFIDDAPDPRYHTESRMNVIKHNNVINFLEIKNKKQFQTGVDFYYGSFILMELAPFGSLTDLVLKTDICHDEKLVRTYFFQILRAIEHLHDHKIAHMDLKLPNILIGDDYQAKIADFDGCYMDGDKKLLNLVTKNFRAPEIKSKRCKNPYSADVYSLGVILFALRMKRMPYNEDKPFKRFNMEELLHERIDDFWYVHTQLAEKHRNIEISDDFKKIFNMMTKKKPEERATIKDIKRTKWFNKPIYSPYELKVMMASKYPNLKRTEERLQTE